MKRTLFLTIFIITLFFLSTFIYATSTNKGMVYLSTNKEIIQKEEEIEISLFLENAETVALTAYFTYDESKLEFISGPENINVKQNQIIFVWYDDKGGENPKGGELAKLKFKAKEEGLATIHVSGEFYNKEAKLIKTNTNDIQIQIGKEDRTPEIAENEIGNNLQTNNAKLKTLRLDKEGLTPDFNKDIIEYYLTVPSSENNIEILALSENPNATIEITGNTNLKNGLNVIKALIISEDKTQQNTYTIYVTKTNDINMANTNLETLAIQDVLLTPPFNSNTTYYQTEIPYETENLNILAIPENEKANVKIEGKENLKVGDNIIKINITAENGFTKKTFQINVHRRNQEEEIQHEKEENQNKEKLEEAYQIEKTNAKIIEQQNKIEGKKPTVNIFIIALIGLSLIILIIFLIKIIKAKSKL